MKRLIGKVKGTGSAGLSLIELIISMAILAVVGIAVGGAMYVSSHSYSRGSAEVDVQEEAQIASSLICDWLVDATEVTPDRTESTYLDITHPEGNTEIKIHVYYDSSDNTLKYTAVDGAGNSYHNTDPGKNILASNVSGVNFYSSFDDLTLTDPTTADTIKRNVKFSIDFDVNGRTYHSVTDSTSRNHDFISTGGGGTVGAPIISFENIYHYPGTDEYFAIMEPGQNETNNKSGKPDLRFTFIAKVYGYDSSNTTFSMDSASGFTCTQVGSSNQWEIVCTTANNAKNDIVLKFNATKTIPGESPMGDHKEVTIHIRRVNNCEFDNAEGVYNASESGSAAAGKAGAVYDMNYLKENWQWQKQYFGSGFDSGVYAYRDPSHVNFYYRYADGSDATSAVTVSEINSLRNSGERPGVKVKLNQDIDKDIYVYAVADHSGVLLPHQAALLNGGLTFNSNNRVSAMEGENFTYGGSTAYVGRFVIKKGTGGMPTPYNYAGAGINRGTPSFEVGRLNSDFLDKLRTFLRGKGYDDNAINSGTFNYWCTIRYTDQVTHVTKEYVVSVTDNWDVMSQHAFTQMFKDESYLFQLDHAYDIEVLYTVTLKSTNEQIYEGSDTGVIPAAAPEIYNPATGVWSADTYNSSNPYVFHRFVDSQYIPVYFYGVNMNNNRITTVVEKYNESTGTWEQVTDSNITNKLQYEWKESSFTIGSNTVNKVILDDAAHTAYTIQGYNENNYPDVGVTVEMIKLDQNLDLGSGNYRLAFKTDFNSINESAVNFGSKGYSEGSVPSSAVISVNDYDLSTDSGTYIYFKQG